MGTKKRGRKKPIGKVYEELCGNISASVREFYESGGRVRTEAEMENGVGLAVCILFVSMAELGLRKRAIEYGIRVGQEVALEGAIEKLSISKEKV